MKSKILISVMMVASLVMATSMTNTVKAQAKVKTEMVKTKKYYCPHHPEQVSDKPGKCAVCGMDLVEMKDMEKMHNDKSMKMDKDKMKMEKNKMKGDMKKMDQDKTMKDSMDMKKGKMDTTKMKMEKM
ncbi:MAG: heavy metal-binding domain-containing protein [Prolixibacteraceae bacterium]|jgi:Cu(I)/Ag(I) efflux system membrane fusion protein